MNTSGLRAMPKLAPPEPPNRGGPHKKGGPVNSQWVVLFNQRMIQVPYKPILRFNIFFVFTRAMWGPHTIFMFLALGARANFSKNSSRKTSKQTFSSIPKARGGSRGGCGGCIPPPAIFNNALDKQSFSAVSNLS